MGGGCILYNPAMLYNIKGSKWSSLRFSPPISIWYAAFDTNLFSTETLTQYNIIF